MTGLDSWLTQATRHLAKDSAAQVRTEIQEHYESARDAASTGGVTADEADRLALQALGDAKTANRQYRQVLLTSAEAKMLRDGNREARALCSRPWLFAAAPLAAMAAAAVLFLTGKTAMAQGLLIMAIGMVPTFVAPLLPIFTPSRGRVFRWVKWVGWIGALALVFGPEMLKWFWLPMCSLWPLAWTEWTRASLRRKLPVEKWPKNLYL